MAFEFLNTIYFANPLISWIYFFATIVIFVLIAKSFIFFTKGFGRRITQKIPGELDDILLDLIEEPLAFLMFVFGVFLGYQFLTFDQSVNFYFYNIIKLLGIVGGTWIVLRLIDTILTIFIKPLTSKTKTKFDDQITQVLSKALKVVTIILAIIISLDSFGFDVFTLIAGLGIGGLAIAFAAQKTVADVFGGLNILISRPFILGDTVEIAGNTGTVEEISLRHTKIRNLEKRLMVFPNSLVSEAVITNITSAPQRKTIWKIGVTYNTPLSKLEKAKKIIYKAIEDCELCQKEPVVAFEEFGSSSLNIFVMFFTKTGIWKDMVLAKDEIGLTIKKEFEKENIEFALPTQTIYLENDNKTNNKKISRKK